MKDQPIALRDTLEDIVRARDEALKLYREASKMIAEANKLVEQATRTSATSYRWSIDRHTIGSIGGADFRDTIQNKIDAHVWRHIFKATSLGDLFNTKKRKEFEEVLEGKSVWNNERGVYVDEPVPTISVENVMATAMTLSAKSGEIFEESVHDLFTELKRRFKSHSGVGFGSRLIFEGVMSWAHMSTYHEQLIWDLERVIYLLDDKSPPLHYGGLMGDLRTYRSENGHCDTGEIVNEYFKVRWYKNGNLHVWLLRDDLTEKMNLSLAKSDQLPAAAE